MACQRCVGSTKMRGHLQQYILVVDLQQGQSCDRRVRGSVLLQKLCRKGRHSCDHIFASVGINHHVSSSVHCMEPLLHTCTDSTCSICKCVRSALTEDTMLHLECTHATSTCASVDRKRKQFGSALLHHSHHIPMCETRMRT